MSECKFCELIAFVVVGMLLFSPLVARHIAESNRMVESNVSADSFEFLPTRSEAYGEPVFMGDGKVYIEAGDTSAYCALVESGVREDQIYLIYRERVEREEAKAKKEVK